MKTKGLREIMFDYQNGSPARRLNKAGEARIRLSQEMVRLRDEAAHQCAEYKRNLEAWTSRRIEGLPRPLALPQDIRDGRLFCAGATVLSLLELVLAFFIALSFGSNPLFFLLLGALLLSGCQVSGAKTSGQAAAPAPVAKQESGRMRLDVYVDWSLSAEARPLNEAAKSLVAALPAMAEEHRVERVAAFQFGRSGWDAGEIVAIDLPAIGQAARSEAAEIFGQVKNAQQNDAAQDYRAQLQEKLRDFTAARLLPPADAPEPRCTDLQGVFRRVAEHGSRQRRVAIIITDGHDTCSGKLRPVSLANALTAIVVVLTTEKAMADDGKPPAADYDQRRAEIAKAIPGAVVIPYFDDLAAAVKDAVAGTGEQRHK